MVSHTPLLTVIIIGRDDGYMPDFRYRLKTTLEHFAANVNQLGRQDACEIVFVDWGSEPPLSDTLALSETASRLVRWLYIGKTTIVDIQKDATLFHNTLAFNAGLRRTSGRYAAFFPADAVMSVYSLERLLELLDGKISTPSQLDETLFYIARGHVPWQFVATEPSIAAWDHYLWLNAWTIPIDRESTPSLFGGAAAFVMSRQLWLASGGLDERMGGWGGSDTDIGFRIGLQFPWLDLSFLGVKAYHMEHGPGGTRAKAVAEGNPIRLNQSLSVNEDNWGLADYEFTITTNQVEIPSPDQSRLVSQAGPIVVDRINASCDFHDNCRKNVPSAARTLRKTVRRLGRHLSHFPRTYREAEGLLACASLCIQCPPRSLIDFGVRSPLLPCVVSQLAPYATIHGVAPDPPEVVYGTAHCLHVLMRHAGYVHFVMGDPATAVDRTFDASPNITTCDVAVVPCELDDTIFRAVVRQIEAHIVPGGVYLLQARSRRAFDRRWGELQTCFSSCRFLRVGNTGCNGIMVFQPKASSISPPNNGVDHLLLPRWIITVVVIEMKIRHRIKKLGTKALQFCRRLCKLKPT